MIIEAYDHIPEVKALFSEYTEMLLSIDPSFRIYLDIQHYDKEAENPALKYARPEGRLYIDIDRNTARGCIALRSLGEGKGEVKRLYVRPEYRGMGIASALLGKILKDALEVGYRELYLDTLPELESAISLYRKYGFSIAEPYNDSPIGKTIFMKKVLSC